MSRASGFQVYALLPTLLVVMPQPVSAALRPQRSRLLPWSQKYDGSTRPWGDGKVAL